MKHRLSRRARIVTLLLGLAAAAGLALARGVLSAGSPTEVWHILSDACFVPGILLLSVGLLIFASNEGGFDGLTYAVRQLFNRLRNEEKRREFPRTFYDYREMKAAKGKADAAFLLVAGLCITALALIFLGLWFASGGV